MGGVMAKKAEKKVANTPSSEEVEAVENAEVAPEETAPTEEWKSVAIESVLELTEKQAEKLEEAGIKTVGQFEHLRSGQMDGYPDGLRSLKGVGQKTVDVWEEQIVEWLSANAREAQPAAAAESGGE